MPGTVLKAGDFNRNKEQNHGGQEVGDTDMLTTNCRAVCKYSDSSKYEGPNEYRGPALTMRHQRRKRWLAMREKGKGGQMLTYSLN